MEVPPVEPPLEARVLLIGEVVGAQMFCFKTQYSAKIVLPGLQGLPGPGVDQVGVERLDPSLASSLQGPQGVVGGVDPPEECEGLVIEGLHPDRQTRDREVHEGLCLVSVEALRVALGRGLLDRVPPARELVEPVQEPTQQGDGQQARCAAAEEEGPRAARSAFLGLAQDRGDHALEVVTLVGDREEVAVVALRGAEGQVHVERGPLGRGRQGRLGRSRSGAGGAIHAPIMDRPAPDPEGTIRRSAR